MIRDNTGNVIVILVFSGIIIATAFSLVGYSVISDWRLQRKRRKFFDDRS